MLNALGNGQSAKHSRSLRRGAKLWNDQGRHTPSLGCTICPDREVCGGLTVGRDSYDCLDYCCGKPGRCDSVCRNKPRDFAQRVREVAGFGLDNVPRAAPLPCISLPSVVPVLYHGDSRKTRFGSPAVCLPFSTVIRGCFGKNQFTDGDAIAAKFKFKAGTALLLTGTATDRPLERWWSLGTGRLDTIRRLHELGVELITTPNFSLFTDRPRWDDMHSIKRIAITHEEFLRVGLRAALHVNARTERDWERWANYILCRSEVTHVAFEFTTGAGRVRRIDWHAKQLANLARVVGRPLHLVLRAGRLGILPGLLAAFERTTLFETTSFMKAVSRQRGITMPNGKMKWLTDQNASVDDLLKDNSSLVSRSYQHALSKATVLHEAE